MARPIPTSLRTLALAVQAKLAAISGMDSSRVRLAARDGTPRFTGDDDLIVRFSGPSPVPGYQHGASRLCTIVERVCSVECRVRVSLDESDGHDIALTDQTYGLYRLEELVLDALHEWVPQSGSDWLTQCPMEWVGSPPAGPASTPPQSWISSRIEFKVTYQASLSDNGF